MHLRCSAFVEYPLKLMCTMNLRNRVLCGWIGEFHFYSCNWCWCNRWFSKQRHKTCIDCILLSLFFILIHTCFLFSSRFSPNLGHLWQGLEKVLLWIMLDYCKMRWRRQFQLCNWHPQCSVKCRVKAGKNKINVF